MSVPSPAGTGHASGPASTAPSVGVSGSPSVGTPAPVGEHPVPGGLDPPALLGWFTAVVLGALLRGCGGTAGAARRPPLSQVPRPSCPAHHPRPPPDVRP